MRQIMIAALLVGTTAGHAQVVDQGTLVIRQSGREIGREEFTVQNGRAGGAPGSTLVARGRYPAVTPAVSFDASVERRTDGSFTSIELERSQGRKSSRYVAELTPRNVLRIHSASSAGSEGVREYAGVPGLVSLADSTFVLYLAVAELSSTEGRTLVALFPETGKQATFTAQRSNGDGRGNSRIVMTGEISGTIWLDDQGRLDRLEFPSLELEAVRLRR